MYYFSMFKIKKNITFQYSLFLKIKFLLCLSIFMFKIFKLYKQKLFILCYSIHRNNIHAYIYT